MSSTGLASFSRLLYVHIPEIITGFKCYLFHINVHNNYCYIPLHNGTDIDKGILCFRYLQMKSSYIMKDTTVKHLLDHDISLDVCGAETMKAMFEK